MRLAITVLASIASVSAAFTKLGCYPSSAILLLTGDTNIYQSLGHCSQVCSDSSVFGLSAGNQCYCGSSVPLTDQEVDLSNCDTPCDGYSQELCGGSNYVLLYVDASKSYSTVDSSSSSSTALLLASETLASQTQASSTSHTSLSLRTSSRSSSQSSSSLSKETSSSSPSSSTISSTSSTPSSSSTKASVQTLVSTVTAAASGSQSILSVTTTLHASLTSEASKTSDSGSPEGSGKDKKKSISTGGIVGAVIGSIAGLLLIIAAIVFFIWRRRQEEDDKDDEFTLLGPPEQKHPYNINNNPFLSAHGDAGAVTGAGAGVIAGQVHNNLNSFSSSHGDDDFYLSDQPKMDLGEKRSLEFGRRRLSDGSLPDMTRNPSTLKVVNN